MTEYGGPSCELVRPEPRTAVAVLAGEHDVTTLPLLRQVQAPLSLDSGLLVVIDLSRATFIDAAVLTALRGVEQAVTGRGGRFGLLPGTAPTVRRILKLPDGRAVPVSSRGHTPVVTVTGGHNTRVSLAALIATRPGCQPRLIYRTHQGRCWDHGRKAFTETDYARLLDAAACSTGSRTLDST